MNSYGQFMQLSHRISHRAVGDQCHEFQVTQCLGSMQKMEEWKKDSRSSIIRKGITQNGFGVIGDECSSNRLRYSTLFHGTRISVKI